MAPHRGARHAPPSPPTPTPTPAPTRFQGLDPDQLSRLRLSLFGGELDATGLARMRLSEHAVHTWDVAVVADPGATLAPDATALLVGNLGPLAERSGRGTGPGVRIGVTTSEPVRRLALRVGDRVEITETEAAGPDATVNIPAEALVRLVYGRLDPAHTPRSIVAEGVDLELLRATFPGF